MLHRLTLAGLLALGASPALAGFLEMPDTSEVPDKEESSLLMDLDIPGVRERATDPSAGPRLNVTQFRVQGVVEYPELGITRKSLSDLVESIRFDLMGEGEMLESGYTLNEVSEISDLIAEIEDEADERRVAEGDVERLVFLIREQRQRRGVTVGMIEAVADTITRYYRERGFILAKAYIPQQRVRDGVVTLTLLLGNLGEVEVVNNKRYRPGRIRKIFEPVIDRPVTAADIEERLFLVNDQPGLSAQAYFEPGAQVGDTQLTVNVVKERMFAGNVRLDNHGSVNTGEYRAYVDGYWFNPTGFGDQLHVGVLGTFEPSNSTYGSVHYGLPLFTPRAKFTIGASSNDFLSNPAPGFSLSGQSDVFDASLNYILKRSRVKNYSVDLTVAEIRTDISQIFDAVNQETGPLPPEFEEQQRELQELYDDTVRDVSIGFNFDLLQERIRALHQGSVRLNYGDWIKGRSINQDENPVTFSFNYSLLKFVPAPFTDQGSRLILRAAGQYGENALPSTSQFSLSGPNRSRGFDINQFNADRAIYLGADWIFAGPGFMDTTLGGQPLRDMIQPYVFVDLAYGDSSGPGDIATADNPRTTPPQQATMGSLGFGLKFGYGNFRTSFSYARAVLFKHDVGTAEDLGRDDLEKQGQLFFDLQYSF